MERAEKGSAPTDVCVRMINMKDFIEYIIPVIISVVAIVFGGYQLFVSNKQFLFEKRLKLYRKYQILLDHQKEAKICIDNSESFIDHDALISKLTNDNEFASMCHGWNSKTPLLEPDDHIKFLSMIEALRTYGEESSFVFRKYGSELYQYFNKYADLCFETYQYRISIEHEKERIHQTDCDAVIKKQKPLGEKIIKTYADMCNISERIQMKKLAKTISLIKKR